MKTTARLLSFLCLGMALTLGSSVSCLAASSDEQAAALSSCKYAFESVFMTSAHSPTSIDYSKVAFGPDKRKEFDVSFLATAHFAGGTTRAFAYTCGIKFIAGKAVAFSERSSPG